MRRVSGQEGGVIRPSFRQKAMVKIHCFEHESRVNWTRVRESRWRHAGHFARIRSQQGQAVCGVNVNVRHQFVRFRFGFFGTCSVFRLVGIAFIVFFRTRLSGL